MAHFTTFHYLVLKEQIFPMWGRFFTIQPYLTKVPWNVFVWSSQYLFTVPCTPVSIPSCQSCSTLSVLSYRQNITVLACKGWERLLCLTGAQRCFYPSIHRSTPPLDWTQTEESAGCGQHRGRGQGLSSHRRNSVGTWRVIGSQCAAGKGVRLLLTKEMVVLEKNREKYG